MDARLRKLKDVCVYGGISKEEFWMVTPDMRKKNCDMLKAVSAISSLLLLLLFAVSLHSSIISVNSRLYGIIMVGDMIVCLASFTATMRCPKTIWPLTYIFLMLFYGFAIVLGTYLQPFIPATTFCVLLFVGPLIFLDRPYRMTTLLLLVTICFCISSFCFKDFQMANLDIINAGSFLIFAIFLNINMTSIKMRELVHRKHIEQQRDTDELTRLLTKAAMERNIKEYMTDTQESAALLVIDIDDFKSINDNYGHAYGDAILRVMGDCLKQAFRNGDMLGRFGGDEFVVFLPGMEEKTIIVECVEHLTEIMKSRIVVPEKTNYIHGSIGIAFYPKDGVSYEQLFERADLALYESKKMGKDCYTFYLNANEKGE